MLVFLASDKQRLQDLEDATRLHMAWSSIVNDDKLDLTKTQTSQARGRQKEKQEAVSVLIRESWVWLLVPGQPDPRGQIEWMPTRLQGQESVIPRASKKLVHEEALITKIGPARLAIPLKNYIFNQTNHVNTKRLWDYFASYLYFPRLRDKNVMAEGIRDGISKLFCEHFAYAENYDEAQERYVGLITCKGGSVTIDNSSVLVKPEAATKQKESEKAVKEPVITEDYQPDKRQPHPHVQKDGKQVKSPPAAPLLPNRFFGSVQLNPDRLGREAGRIAEEILQHLSTIRGSEVKVTLEIEATVPSCVSEETQRVVTENCQTLKFQTHGFEGAQQEK
jgi:hypothetical protein